MRKVNLFYLFSALVFGALLMVTSCTKEGPAGPAGKDGVDGVDGTDGTPGVDANTHCLNCHTAVKMEAIETAFNETPHAMGASWARGTSASCGMCHSHDGYVEYTRSGAMIAAAVSTPVVCGTCHADHVSLETDMGAPMREVGPVIAIVDETGETVFDHGVGNICATCHQARSTGATYDNQTEPTTFTRTFTGDDIAVYQNGALGPNGSATLNGTGDTLTVVFDVPLTHVYISSTHAGPHHGPMANMFAGIVGYPTNGIVFDRDHHTDCVNCHLNDSTAGYGHSFLPDVQICNNCHGDAFDVEGFQSEVEERMAALEVKLEEIHAIHVEDGEVHPMYASITREEFQAFWNFMGIYEDKSMGIHNPDYTEQMLNLAEDNLGK